jgi:hypothetical protein
MKEKINNVIKYWLPLALTATIILGVIYTLIQQNLRASANDPQVEMAEEAANMLHSGKTPQEVIGDYKIDMANSLSSFLIIYDSNGKPISSSAVLDDTIPSPPAAVFDYVKKHGEDRITWQPTKRVRCAVVIIQYTNGKTGGFVLAGRSLLEIEKRESSLFMEVGVAWLVIMFVSLAATVLVTFILDKSPGDVS